MLGVKGSVCTEQTRVCVFVYACNRESLECNVNALNLYLLIYWNSTSEGMLAYC